MRRPLLSSPDPVNVHNEGLVIPPWCCRAHSLACWIPTGDWRKAGYVLILPIYRSGDRGLEGWSILPKIVEWGSKMQDSERIFWAPICIPPGTSSVPVCPRSWLPSAHTYTHTHTHTERPSWCGVETQLCMTNTDSNRYRGPWQSEVWAQVERAPQGWGQGRFCSKCQLGLEADRGLV